jgi:carboxyl-terminal processing protease
MLRLDAPMKLLTKFSLVLGLTATLVVAQAQTGRQPLPVRELSALAAVFGLIQSSLAKPPDSKELILAALRGLVQQADPEDGEYFSEEEFAEHRSGPKPGDASAGLWFQTRRNSLVATPIKGGPAHNAGFRFGDELRQVDGKDVAGLAQRELKVLLRGATGSRVVLSVFRPSSSQVLELTVTRSEQQTLPAALSRPHPDLVVLHLHSFTSATARDASDLLSRAWTDRAFKGVVLDVRGNPGGLWHSAVSICGLFLPPDTLVATSKGRSAASNQAFKTTQAPSLGFDAAKMPLAVLVDEGTSSGAELVAGALQFHQRARLIGRPTFGRGSLQTVQAIEGAGAVKYTSAFWELPSGRTLHGRPLVPDRTVMAGNPDAEVVAALEDLGLRE